VVSEYCAAFAELLDSYAAKGQYPMNGPIEIRVSGLNHTGEVALAGAVEPSLSALRPRPDRPQWDCAVWLDALTLAGTPESDRFCAELEQWLFGNYTGDYAAVRVEWAKGWGYTAKGAWTDPGLLRGGIPGSLTLGQPAGTGWADAIRTLDGYDPHRIFSNTFLDELLV
jgi:FAD/FMN-containing dehydrogenase